MIILSRSVKANFLLKKTVRGKLHEAMPLFQIHVVFNKMMSILSNEIALFRFPRIIFFKRAMTIRLSFSHFKTKYS